MEAARMEENDESFHSRSNTVIECIKRLKERKYKFNDSNPGIFTLHIVGADHREGNSEVETRRVFGRLIDHFATPLHVHTLQLVCIGPNITRTLHGLRFNSLHQVESQQMNVKTKYFVGGYEDFFANEEAYTAPDLAVCFNAGVWGYDEWLPTISLLAHTIKVPLLITSYNANEASDDEDVITENVSPAHWFWHAEKNPHGSSVERSTGNTIGSVLKENDYWLCIGAMSKDSRS